MLLAHLARLALSRAFESEGNRIAISSAMMPTTTRSSTSVNPRRRAVMMAPAHRTEVQRTPVRYRGRGFQAIEILGSAIRRACRTQVDATLCGYVSGGGHRRTQSSRAARLPFCMGYELCHGSLLQKSCPLLSRAYLP